MRTLDSLGVFLVSVSKERFETWPADRSFKLLAEDARALRRRALKGVSVSTQLSLFLQVSRRIDSLTFEVRDGYIVQLRGTEAEAWLKLEEIVRRESLVNLTKAPMPELVKPILGESVIFPGEEVRNWALLLRVLDSSRLESKSELWKRNGRENNERMLLFAQKLFAVAARNGFAVSQVVFDAALWSQRRKA